MKTTQSNDALARDFENKIILEELLNELPNAGRDLLFLYYIYEMPYQEIAQVVGLSADTVGKRVRNLLEILRSKVEEEHYVR